MRIFNSKSVVGLFDNDQAVDEAVSRLHELGFGEEEDTIQIIDQNRLAQEAPFEASSQEVIAQPDTGIAAGGPSAIFNPITDAGVEGKSLEQSTFEFLTDQGFSQDEATFFSQHMSGHSRLIVVKTSKERVDEAVEAMGQASAKISTD